MLRISNVKAPLELPVSMLIESLAREIGYRGRFKSWKIAKKAIDARSKANVHYVYSIDVEVDNEEALLKNKTYPFIEKVKPEELKSFQIKKSTAAQRPVIIGSGPAGMFAGIALAEAGLKPIILERGAPVSQRQRDIMDFWKNAELKEDSNVQFGEGGAGTFSDGKLMSGIKKDLYTAKVLQELIAAGAPEEIGYLAKPHIGTDKLALAVQKIRAKIESLGGEYRFHNRVEDLLIKEGKLQGLKVRNEKGEIYELAADKVILAIGHSARDTFEMLYKNQVQIQQKPFSIGVRIEHRQSLINKSQYGKFSSQLGAADYKLAYHGKNGRSAYTFCMCPGGVVVAAASEKGRVVTNGMSEFARDRINANSALLVGVTPEDFGGTHPLQGMYWQRQLEEKAFQLGGGNYKAPAQLLKDFLLGQDSKAWGEVQPTYRPGVSLGNLQGLLPPYVTETMKIAILDMNKRLNGFANPDAVLTGIESRSSSPIRINRDDTLQSNVKGLYPCGEGAGYAGGILSAAADGLKCAEKLVESLS